MLHCNKTSYTDGISPERTATMPSTTAIFDSYVLKCWADTARLQTLALTALADFFEDRLDDRLEDRHEDRLETPPDRRLD